MVVPETKRNWMLTALLVLFATTYILGALYLLLGRAGAQSMPPDWRHGSLSLYACVFLFGAISSITALRWKRWGVLGLSLTWLATAVLNLVLAQPVDVAATTLAVLLVVAFAVQVGRSWRSCAE
jgi:hypothetical protein